MTDIKKDSEYWTKAKPFSAFLTELFQLAW